MVERNLAKVRTRIRFPPFAPSLFKEHMKEPILIHPLDLSYLIDNRQGRDVVFTRSSLSDKDEYTVKIAGKVYEQSCDVPRRYGLGTSRLYNFGV